jgi:mono/diheme cytochrome c family protein
MTRAMTAAKAPAIVAVLVALAAGIAANAAGGTATSAPDAAKARSLFRSNCGSCHRLKAAGTRGTDGPNLDKRFKGVPRKKIARVTKRAIVNGAGSMPAGLLGGRKAKRVAAYVASVAGHK